MHYFNLNLLVSERLESSLQIFENSALDKVTIELYSVSGIPNYSESSYKRFKLNSENLSFSINLILINKILLYPSNVNLIEDGSSSAYKVIMSSFPAHFNILDKFSMLIPLINIIF